MCPYCRTNAPLVYRGIRAYCAACGRQRTVLSASSLTYAGQGSKAGGAALRVFGCGALLIGGGIASVFGLLFWAAVSATAGLIAGGILFGLSLLVFWLLNRGGRSLEQSGDQARQRKREQALFAMAATSGGMLRPVQAAAALELTVDEADKFLTDLAKTRPSDVGVEVTDEGEVVYTFPQLMPRQATPWGTAASFDERLRERMRIAASARPPSQPPAKVVDADFRDVEAEREAQADDAAQREGQSRVGLPKR
ncbi:MAG: hypothetical protein U0271_12105 [Polyangiaceae bacterium]